MGRYDIVIANGRIVDGTGNAWFYGDVGITGDRIARVTPAGMLGAASAKYFIDARGLVVSPGFIDIQSHSWDALLWRDGRVVGKVTQGVTTEILGESTTPGPLNDEMLKLLELPDTLPQLTRCITRSEAHMASARGCEFYPGVNIGDAAVYHPGGMARDAAVYLPPVTATVGG